MPVSGHDKKQVAHADGHPESCNQYAPGCRERQAYNNGEATEDGDQASADHGPAQ
jgi:hypothetical protein